jgi:DNA-binding NtrC family response regulator
MNRPELQLSREAKQALLKHPFPGNVRELKNAMERATALCTGDTLGIDDLPPEFSQQAVQLTSQVASHQPVTGPKLSAGLDHREAELIQEALALSGNRRGEAARLLGISRKTLWKKMKRPVTGW